MGGLPLLQDPGQPHWPGGPLTGPPLSQHNSFRAGDVVRVIDGLDTVKRLQAGHGEWTDDVAPVRFPAFPHPVPPSQGGLPVTSPSPQALGHVGKVVKVSGDGNLRVAVSGQLWTFSPSCLVACQPEEACNLDVAERTRENKSAGIWWRRPWALVPLRAAAEPQPLTPGSLSVALDKLRTQKSNLEHPGRLVVEVALGNLAGALDLLRRHPEVIPA